MCKEYINLQTKEKLDLDKISELPENHILRIRPEFWIEWDFKKNDELGYDIWTFSKSSRKIPWFICKKCGSEYKKQPYVVITRNGKCTYCAGKKVNHTNSLRTTHPEIVTWWDFNKNTTVTPDEVSKGSRLKVWWVCKNCKESYIMIIQNRLKSSEKCPYCLNKRVNKRNSLTTMNPELTKEWHPTKNGNLTANDVSSGSHKKVWWLGKCGHEWESTVYVRNIQKSECCICTNREILIGFNDMWTTNPELAKLLANPEDGYKYTKSSNYKVDWRCDKCSNIIRDKHINNVSQQGLRCSLCKDSLSFGEKIMYQLLKLNDIEFLFNNSTVFSNKLRYDFILDKQKIIIEIHGLQHYKDTGFHKLRGKTSEQEFINDRFKKTIALENGYSYFEINASKSDFNEIKENIINSGLIEILDIQIETFNEINMDTSLILQCWDLWYNKKMLKIEISKELGISRNLVAKYIKIKEQTRLIKIS